MTGPIPPYDEQIQALIAELAEEEWRDRADGQRLAERLVALATAAAYRHAAAYLRQREQKENANPIGSLGAEMTLSECADFFEAWAEKAEQA